MLKKGGQLLGLSLNFGFGPVFHRLPQRDYLRVNATESFVIL